jgi:outer membrane receptor protein involved in Fe transport
VKALLFGLFPTVVGALPAQDVRPDTTQTLGAIVVIAERAATSLNRSTAAVTRLTAPDLARLPYTTVADVLKHVPGFGVVDFDGSGRDSQLMVRGFYGGGEADYVLVMVDGRVVNLPHNGTIAWETLPPLSNIESIEIVRGSASALHGDAAVAGVINIVTRRPDRLAPTWRLGAESFSGFTGSVDISNAFRNRPLHASLGFDRTNGFRDHAARTSATAGASLQLNPAFRASLRTSWRDFEEPGPLLERLLQDGSESDPRFRLDGGDDTQWSGTLTHDGVLGAGGTASSSMRVAGRTATLVRTLPISAVGDTRERALRTADVVLATQADLLPTILPPGTERFSIGGSLGLGSIDSRYFSSPDGGTRSLDAEGNGKRTTLGAFVHLVGTPTDWMRWTVGVRADYLNDDYENETGGTDFNESHFALSPKVGVNVRYADGSRSSGRFWVSFSRTFKAPTPDQLFDQRPIPIPFPPFTLTTSNPELEPQRGAGAETGIYHEVTVAGARLGATVTVYRLDMRDELDFDLQTFKYVNIGRSRHRGFEAGLNVSGDVTSGFASITLQDVKARAGANAGNRLKAIPGQLYSAGITVSPKRLGTGTVSVTRTADMFIDDANTRRIPSWTRIDGQVARSVGPFAIILGARNLLDEQINGTGFLDPGGSGEAHFYPAAGRVFTLGVRHGR